MFWLSWEAKKETREGEDRQWTDDILERQIFAGHWEKVQSVNGQG